MIWEVMAAGFCISILDSESYGGRERCAQGFGGENLRERDHWGDQDVDGRLILRWVFSKWEGVVGTGWSWLRIGTGGGRL